MKVLTIFFCIVSNVALCQIKTLKSGAFLNKTVFIEVYKKNMRTHNCVDQKTAEIMEGNKINPCFDRTKKLSAGTTKLVLNILSDKKHHTAPTMNCYASDYGLIFLDGNRKMVGVATMSLVCKNISIGSSLIGLDTVAKNKLLALVWSKQESFAEISPTKINKR